MINRLTNPSKEYVCRMKDCDAEEWMHKLYGSYPSLNNENPCFRCPFLEIINKLAEYEDKEYIYEDDLK